MQDAMQNGSSGRYSKTPLQKAAEYLQAKNYSQLARKVGGRIRAKVGTAITPIVRRKLAGGHFIIGAKEYTYFISARNSTWANERAVEISYAKEILKHVGPCDLMEIGNVLKNYLSGDWLVCDKYDSSPGIEQQDVLSLAIGRKFKRIISVSTLEHVGFDEPCQKIDAFPLAMSRIAEHLEVGGEFHCTLPIGYNPIVDQHLRDGSVKFDKVIYLLRDGMTSWRMGSSREAHEQKYGHPYGCANALAICVVSG